MATTARGHIEKLPSGSLRVHVYAGTDPVTGKPRRLKQTCPDEASAAAALGKLLAQADGDHFPNREATLGQALAKYLEVADSRSRPGRRTRATSAAPSGRCSAR
jgi:integrase